MIDWIFNKSGAEIVCLQEVFSKEHKRLFWKKAAQEGWTFLAPADLIYGGVPSWSLRMEVVSSLFFIPGSLYPRQS
jgi:exonuclease III